MRATKFRSCCCCPDLRETGFIATGGTTTRCWPTAIIRRSIFFFRTPNNAYTNLEVCSQKIDTDYQPVTDGSRQLGDIVMLMIGEHSVVHSCNIVAGDIVFTKNGTAQGQPWVLADLKQIVNYFSIEQPVTIRIVRSKEFAK